ncbi:MAG: DUF4339 domain-containing protein [Planctomycetota bacterium]|jgi:hypothetical protein
MAEYYLKIRPDGQPQGPYSGGRLKKLAASGKLEPTHLVSKDGTKWKPAGKIPGLDFGGNECPSCQAGMEQDSVICMECGYNVATGKALTEAAVPDDDFDIPEREAAPSKFAPVQSTQPSGVAYVLCGWPLILVFFGGLIGGMCGGLAYGINIQVYQSRMNFIFKALIIIVSGLGAFVAYAVIAAMLFSATR